MTLLHDITRCPGVHGDEGLIAPCSTCRRVLEAEPSGPRTPWFVEAPLHGGQCESHLEGKP